ncbi:MAG: EAL domain-containing protein, partial [Methylobacteriaceae bacterium]|nr:EAL domain-containing protein [Methylobacteriaceae bacterium]
VMLADSDEAIDTLHKLRALGVRIAMDDFGTGYSSLSYLSRFAFDKIKIDGSFIRNLGKAREAEAIVNAVLQLGESLDVAINAEGVETEAQFLALRKAGCDQVQGYPFSPPVPAPDFEAQLTRDRAP